MVEIPTNPVTEMDLNEWYLLQKELKAIKSKEILLRAKIFKGLFKNPREGTNTLGLPDGFLIKAGHKINRTIDRGALEALADKFAEAGIFTDQLVEYKPELKIGMYRELTAEQMQLFDQALIVKEGTPDLEIMQPKRLPRDVEMAVFVPLGPPLSAPQ